MQDANNMETVSTDGDGVRGHIEHYVLSVQGSVKLYPELNLFFFQNATDFMIPIIWHSGKGKTIVMVKSH